MKKLNLLLTAVLMLFMIISLSAQTPPHPNGGNSPGSSNIPIGGGAPIGSGIFLLIGMGAVYGGKKFINFRKENQSLI